MDPSLDRLFRTRLLAWYRRHARILPWRENRDPYRVWISEIMLQQTQVRTVIPYYEKWMRRWPRLEDLAAARLEEVLHAWAGLGYYRRARQLHETARRIREDFGGRFPLEPAELMKLPGIGRYSAGAITSIAGGRPEPVLDGNVIRILTRLGAVREDIDLASTRRRLWDLAARLVPARSPGDFNQAMMELGATVCLPDAPACGTCPVSALCGAFAEGSPGNYPFRTRREKITKKTMAALVLSNRGRVLIRRQGEKERWGGLWMFPFGESREGMLEKLGMSLAGTPEKWTRIEHGFTRYRILLDVYRGRLDAESGRSVVREGADVEERWVRPSELSRFAFPAPHGKIVRHLVGRS